MTTASGFNLEKRLIREICSPIEADLNLWTYLSCPFWSIILGEVPVVFPILFRPPDLNPAEINLTTLDFPLDPFTWIRIGILDRLFEWILN